jgi:hypothetical protein
MRLAASSAGRLCAEAFDGPARDGSAPAERALEQDVQGLVSGRSAVEKAVAARVRMLL